MAAENVWEGGTTAAAQIETFTLNNDFNDDETAVFITMTGEDGNTSAVTITPDGTNESVIAALLQVALAASTNALFTAVTWTVASNVITGTAKVAGIPFYAASTVTGTGTSTDSESTSNAGPCDWNTAANWDTGVKPASGDHVKFAQGSYDVLYGLDQSAINLDDLKVGTGYTGTIGDTANGYYLQIAVNNGTASSGEKTVVLNSGGKAVWLNGTMPSVYVMGCTGGNHAVELKGTTTTLTMSGSSVRGTVRVAASTAIANIYLLNCPQARLFLGATLTTLALLEMNSGRVSLKSPFTTTGILNIAGGDFTIDYYTSTAATVVVANIEQRGGVIHWNANGTIGTSGANGPLILGGVFDLTGNNQGTLSIFYTRLRGGTWIEKGAPVTVSYNSELYMFGGDSVGITANPQEWGA